MARRIFNLTEIKKTIKPLDYSSLLKYVEFTPSDFFQKALISRMSETGVHQYSRSYGNLKLAETIANFYPKNRFCRSIDPINEVLIVAGSSSGFFNITQSLINKGDKVIMMRPVSKKSKMEEVVKLHGGIPEYVDLRPDYETKKWEVDFSQYYL